MKDLSIFVVFLRYLTSTLNTKAKNLSCGTHFNMVKETNIWWPLVPQMTKSREKCFSNQAFLQIIAIRSFLRMFSKKMVKMSGWYDSRIHMVNKSGTGYGPTAQMFGLMLWEQRLVSLKPMMESFAWLSKTFKRISSSQTSVSTTMMIFILTPSKLSQFLSKTGLSSNLETISNLETGVWKSLLTKWVIVYPWDIQLMAKENSTIPGSKWLSSRLMLITKSKVSSIKFTL